MNLILEISNFDNDAMADVDKVELKNELREKICQALLIHGIMLEGSKVYDCNGNKVGEMLIQL